MGLHSAANSLENFKLGLYIKGGGTPPVDPPEDTLNDGLLWYYKLEEATGARVDSSTNTLSLTQGGTVTNTGGIIDNAAAYAAGTTNKLSNSFASQYDLSSGDFSITGWMYFNVLPQTAGSAMTLLYIGTFSELETEMCIRIYASDSVNQSITVDIIESPNILHSAEIIPAGIAINTWHFIAIRYDSATQEMEIRFDGETPTITGSFPNPLDRGTQSFVIGNMVDDFFQINGRIDEVGGWDRYITDEEINFLYSGGSGGQPIFPPPPDSSETLLNGMLWYYKLEEGLGSVRVDSSNNRLYLIDKDVASGVGIIGNCASHDGSTEDRLSNTFAPQYDLSSGDFSITGWINFGSVGGNDRTILYIGTGAANVIAELCIIIKYDVPGVSIQVQISDGVSIHFAQTAAPGITIGMWHFVGVRYNSTSGDLEIRFDGDTPTVFPGTPSPQNQGTQSFVLTNKVDNSEPLFGRLDEVGGWDRYITDAEMNFLYNGGAADRPNFPPPEEDLLVNMLWYYALGEATGDRADSSVNGADLSQVGTVTNDAGILGNAASFTGVATDKLTTSPQPQFDLTGKSWTVSLWWYPTSSNQENLFYIGTDGIVGTDNLLRIRWSGGNLLNTIFVNGGINHQIDNLILNTWHFISLRYDFTDNFTILNYDNEITSGIVNGLIFAPTPPSLVLGNMVNDDGPALSGRLDEAGGWDRYLTDEEIAYLYNDGLGNRPGIPTTAPLVDDEGNTLVDDEGNKLVYSLESTLLAFNKDFNLDFG